MAASTCSGLWVDRPITASLPRKSAGGVERNVLLADMEHRSPGQRGDVRPVIDGPQPPVALRAAGVQDLQQFQFLGRLEGLVAQLDDVHAAGEGGVHEVREVAAVLAGIGAEVQAGGGVDGILAHGTSLVPLNWADTAGARCSLSQTLQG